MSDQIGLSIGAAPWQPSGDSHIERIYDRYDMPTAGVFSQAGCLFLFECIEGVNQKVNVWAYAPLLSWESSDLDGLSGEDLIASMEKVWQTRDVTVALATDDKLLTAAVVSDFSIQKVGLLGAALEELLILLRREITATEALQGVTN